MRWAGAAAFLVLFVVPMASAQINGPEPFRADFPFAKAFTGDDMLVVSGKVNAGQFDADGAYAFFDAAGFTVDGLAGVCWTGSNAGCDLAGGLRLVARNETGADEAAIGLRFPGGATGLYSADHMLGLFVDLGDDAGLNGIGVGHSLLGPSVNGRMVFSDLERIVPARPQPDFARMGTLTGLDSSTRIDVMRGAATVTTLDAGATAFFDGRPTIAPFSSDLALLPFEERAQAAFAPASDAAVAKGMDLARIVSFGSAVQSASADATQEKPQSFGGAINELEEIMRQVLNGAILRVPTDEVTEERLRDELVFIRFESLRVRFAADTLSWTGASPLHIQEGEVQGAQPIFGVSIFNLPWWGYVVWAVAVSLSIVRMIVKPPKTNPRWDQRRWIGTVAWLALVVITFFLWDLEMRAVWGTSVMTTTADGGAFWITFAIQIGTLFMTVGLLGEAFAMLFKEGLRLAGQGMFMGLGRPAAYLLGYLLGALLMLSYVNSFLQNALGRL